MKIYSHVKEVNGQKIGSKLLKDHLQNVYNIALKSFFERNELSKSIDFKEVLKDLCYLHDIGKYTDFFQKYLLGAEISHRLKEHSQIGAFAILNKYSAKPLFAAFLYILVKKHHGNLPDFLDIDLMINEFPEIKNYEKQIENLKNKFEIINNELKYNDLEKLLKIPEIRPFRKALRIYIKNTPEIVNYFTINYLFSLLIEADKLDASETGIYSRKPINHDLVSKFLKVSSPPERKLTEITSFRQNELRNYVRFTVLENLKSEEILQNHIFTLTAPTGIGKTLTSLDFALNLKKIIREKENYEAQIIYGLPFINIIEQNLDVYYKVFADEIKKSKVEILAHYQYSDVFGKDDEMKGDGGEKYNKRKMLLNTWQSDIVITSFVQFFETLISNRNKMLLKFNHLAGAIIILDEVQTLRLEQLPLLGAVLYYLTKYLKSHLILMTATKPKIFELANEIILKTENEKVKSFELLKDNEQVFAKFKRTKIIPLLQDKIVDNQDFLKLFKEKRTPDKSCLVVCNTVQRSIDIFKILKQNGVENLYYLSTNIVPAKRLGIIEEIKKKIQKGEKPVLVSTQVVEAGVDLDFDMGFRDLAPIDSIVQVAGRINRENSSDREHSPLYVVCFSRGNGQDEVALVYDNLTKIQAESALKGFDEIPEENYFELIDNYFSNLAEKKSFAYSEEMFAAMKKLKYETDDKNEKAVNKFKIIEEASWAVSVFIELNEKATEALQAFNQLIDNEISIQEFDRKYKRAFNQYIIAIPEKFAKNLENINAYSEILLVRNENLKNYYNPETGFIRCESNTELYSL